MLLSAHLAHLVEFIYMNKKKRNSYHLQHPFHITYLTIFPVIFIIAALIGGLAYMKAHDDLTRVGQYVRGVRHPGLRPGISYHKVRNFDTLESIAEEYNISVDTIRWANELPAEGISENMIIMIPPVTGIVHTVQHLETIESIAYRYKVDPKKITDYPYNQFSNDPAFPITPGQTLIVPDGKK
ncbi:hypothetical protein BH09PAT2_BH09PAT2_05750 [soil metagenome]